LEIYRKLLSQLYYFCIFQGGTLITS